MRRNLLTTSAVLAVILMTSACTTTTGGDNLPFQPVFPPNADPSQVSINSGYRAGEVKLDSGESLPTLQDLIHNSSGSAAAGGYEIKEEDRLRHGAMMEQARKMGAIGGLAWTSQQINKTLEKRSNELTRIYDFNKIMIRAPGDVKVLPPVISEALDTYETAEAGKALRIADQYYEIISQAQFTPNAPLWHSYLIRTYETPQMATPELLPKNDQEKRMWEQWVKEGWAAGSEQANAVFLEDTRRLERDFNGMIRYKILLAEGKVSAPVVAQGDLGVTGSGSDMRVNDRIIRITQDPSLIMNPDKWKPTTKR